MIYECSAAVNTTGQRQTRLRARRVASIVKDDIDRSICRIDRHPREELLLSILYRIVVHTHRSSPRVTTIPRRHHEHIRVTIARVDPVEVERSLVWSITQIHSGHRHAIRSAKTLDRNVPTTGHLADHFVFPKRQTTINRFVEHQTERSGPHQIHFTVRSHRRHRALDGVVAIETVTTSVRDSKRHRESLSLIGRAREIDL